MSSAPSLRPSCKSNRRGCKECGRRRISCDLAQPNCVKCTKKGIQCSGYGRTFRWANAIAVRGRYKGMLQPHALATPNPKAVIIHDSTLKPVQTDVADNSEWSEPARIVARIFPQCPTVSEIHNFVRYYDDTIASKMVWVDSSANAYRRLVLPRAKTKPVLLLAILAVAAEHIAASRGEQSTFSRDARNQAVSSITKTLQKITEPGRTGEEASVGTVNLETAEWVLATMLILSNFECVEPASSAWCLHRLGARTLLNAITFPYNRRPTELYVFLRSQFSIYDILASTTTSVFMNSQDAILPCPGEEKDLFSEYMELIHDVTSFSRQGRSFTRNFLTPEVLRKKLEMARGMTLMAAGRIYDIDQNEKIRYDLIHLAGVYHAATLLYAYRQAYDFPPSHLAVRSASEELFECLGRTISSIPQALNLLWPAFIAGTECRGNEERQEEVSGWFDAIVKASGFGEYHVVRTFLNEFWKSEEENWLGLAEDWERNGRPLLVV